MYKTARNSEYTTHGQGGRLDEEDLRQDLQEVRAEARRAARRAGDRGGGPADTATPTIAGQDLFRLISAKKRIFCKSVLREDYRLADFHEKSEHGCCKHIFPDQEVAG